MVVDTKLYDLLGVSPNATDGEIKKAFHKKALELHPDKHRDDPSATEKFQAVNEAYDILKDKQKRENYDRFGLNGLKGEDNGDFFNAFFSNFFGFFDSGFSSPKRNQMPRTQNRTININITLNQAYTGSRTYAKYNRNVTCSKCNGKGTKSGNPLPPCPKCHGRGEITTVRREGNVVYQNTNPCSFCQQTGLYANPKDTCPQCNGKRVIFHKETLTVQIPPGTHDNDTFKFEQLSDEAPGSITGDLYVKIHIQQNNDIYRRGDHLLIEKVITLSEALLVKQFKFKHLDGRILILNLGNQIIHPEQTFSIKGEGMPINGNILQKGDLFVLFHIVFPDQKDLTPELKNALKKYIPSLNHVPNQQDPDNVEVINMMKDADINDFGKISYNERRKEAYESDNNSYYQGSDCNPM